MTCRGLVTGDAFQSALPAWPRGRAWDCCEAAMATDACMSRCAGSAGRAWAAGAASAAMAIAVVSVRVILIALCS